MSFGMMTYTFAYVARIKGRKINIKWRNLAASKSRIYLPCSCILRVRDRAWFVRLYGEIIPEL